MDTISSVRTQHSASTSSNSSSLPTNKAIIYSAPASPGSPASAIGTETTSTVPSGLASANPPSPTSATTAQLLGGNDNGSLFHTPKKSLADSDMLQRIREKLGSPSGTCELQTIHLEPRAGEEPVNVIKHRYLISTQVCHIPPAVAAKTPASYRHLIDLTASSLKCTDVFTEREYLCKIINEPLDKVQRAYFQLSQEGENARSSLYGHALIRCVHDIVPLSKHRTYLIIAPPQAHEGADTLSATSVYGDLYEDLHTYIRNKRRLCEVEARALFHQICETVRVCHRNGIILRDLKLKRFYFIDEARTKLQYESLEGSMILDDLNDDTLSDKIGCPLYTAPELLCPNPTYHGKPADMWSLGVILYTMLVGQYPFYEKGNCNLITIIRHCQVQIPQILSKSVRWLLMLLLRKNHKERMEAEHVFLSPWLKEQQFPYYMYVPADMDFDEVESNDETAITTQPEEQEEAEQQQQQQQQHEKDCQADRSNSAPAIHLIEECDDAADCDIRSTAEPLDYTRRSLQAHVVTTSRDIHVDDDIEMR